MNFDHCFAKMSSQLSAIVPLSKQAVAQLKQDTTMKFFPKKTVFVHEGEIGTESTWIISGAAKGYSTLDEKQIVRRLYSPGTFCSTLNYVLATPSNITIIFNKDTWVLSNTLEAFLKLCNTYPEVKQLHDLMVQYHGREQEQKVYDLQALTVKQRLQKLMIESPDLFNYFTIADIASYLGTERETLTRIKNSM